MFFLFFMIFYVFPGISHLSLCFFLWFFPLNKAPLCSVEDQEHRHLGAFEAPACEDPLLGAGGGSHSGAAMWWRWKWRHMENHGENHGKIEGRNRAHIFGLWEHMDLAAQCKKKMWGCAKMPSKHEEHHGTPNIWKHDKTLEFYGLIILCVFL